MYIYTHTHHGYYSAIKENEIMPSAAARMDLETVILRKSEEDKYHMISLIYGILKKKHK